MSNSKIDIEDEVYDSIIKYANIWNVTIQEVIEEILDELYYPGMVI